MEPATTVLLNTAVAKAGDPAKMAEPSPARRPDASASSGLTEPRDMASPRRRLPGRCSSRSIASLSARQLDPFYPILPDAAWVARIASQGTKFIQLRVKDMPPHEINAEIARALELAAAHGCQLVVNDYWREAISLGADFVSGR
jgi:hypothetical protein